MSKSAKNARKKAGMLSANSKPLPHVRNRASAPMPASAAGKWKRAAVRLHPQQEQIQTHEKRHQR
nr:hypothetical protein [uncultured Ottowia sp.]